ncbi:MAG: metallophosphoesterase [Prevotella sp.]|nr:metallophosphoesterase [Prevotella sp.]
MLVRHGILFFATVGFVVLPLLVYFVSRWLLPRRYGRRVGVVAAIIIIGMVAYGVTFGFEQLEVRQVEYASSDLPEAFDGYRIVQFSDAHVGTYEGRRAWLLQRAVDSINAQRADMIVFTGDLQNLHPDELVDKVPVLRQLHAPDGVYSVLGNHDYATYLECDEATKWKNNQRTQQLERQMQWTLLLNEHRIIRRDSDSIVIAGMENWGLPKRTPRRGDVRKTMQGVAPQSFTVMLQHNPVAWRQKILPQSHAQLTLSGHTHGGQFMLFGWSPVALISDEWNGAYYEGERSLYVSSGLGGLLPFRLGQPGEIVVITLRKK